MSPKPPAVIEPRLFVSAYQWAWGWGVKEHLYAQENVNRLCGRERHLNSGHMHASITHNSTVKVTVTIVKKEHKSGTCWNVGVKTPHPPTLTSLDQKLKKREKMECLLVG